MSVIGAFASASIAISLYPILKKYSERLALEAVGLRLIEAILYIVSAVPLISLLSLSQQFVKAGAPVSSYFQPLGVVLLATYNWAGSGGAVLAFGLGALMYYFIFYQTKLIPRWLSGWGLLGALMVLTAGLLVMGN